MFHKKYPPIKTLEDKIAACRVIRGAFAFLAGVFFLAIFFSPLLFDIDIPKERVGIHIFITFCLLAGIIASSTAYFAHTHLIKARLEQFEKNIDN